MNEQHYIEIKSKRCTECGEDYTPVINSDECPHNKVGVSGQDELLLTDEEINFYKHLYTDRAHEHFIYDFKGVAKAQLAKAKQHYEQKRLDRPELREKIAKALCEADGYDWEHINKWYVRWFGSITRFKYYRMADGILALVIPENLVERFNQWADERISDYEDMPAEYLEKWRPVQRARIETLQFAKANLERLAKEVDHDHKRSC